MHICRYVCVCIYIYMYVCIYIYIYIHLRFPSEPRPPAPRLFRSTAAWPARRQARRPNFLMQAVQTPPKLQKVISGLTGDL